MRFNILSTAINGGENWPLPSAYVYAWESGVYPLFHEHANWHLPFEDQFRISKADVEELSKYIDECWLKKKVVTFYELEQKYDVQGIYGSSSNWERSTLIYACRYMYLADLFDKPFWNSLLQNGECPSEALDVARPMKISDIYLV
ncbi:MAG: hypothetical protein WCK32_10100 [Chlorobiaceae bacterium]